MGCLFYVYILELYTAVSHHWMMIIKSSGLFNDSLHLEGLS